MKTETFNRRIAHAWHNCIIHPVAGVLWLFGFQRWGDWLHNGGQDVRAVFIVPNVTPEQSERIKTMMREYAATHTVKLSELMYADENGELRPIK